MKMKGGDSLEWIVLCATGFDEPIQRFENRVSGQPRAFGGTCIRK